MVVMQCALFVERSSSRRAICDCTPKPTAANWARWIVRSAASNVWAKLRSANTRERTTRLFWSKTIALNWRKIHWSCPKLKSRYSSTWPMEPKTIYERTMIPWQNWSWQSMMIMHLTSVMQVHKRTASRKIRWNSMQSIIHSMGISPVRIAIAMSNQMDWILQMGSNAGLSMPTIHSSAIFANLNSISWGKSRSMSICMVSGLEGCGQIESFNLKLYEISAGPAGDRIHQCKLCARYYSTIAKLEKHRVKEHPHSESDENQQMRNYEKFSCSYCEWQYSTAARRDKHMKLHGLCHSLPSSIRTSWCLLVFFIYRIERRTCSQVLLLQHLFCDAQGDAEAPIECTQTDCLQYLSATTNLQVTVCAFSSHEEKTSRCRDRFGWNIYSISLSEIFRALY